MSFSFGSTPTTKTTASGFTLPPNPSTTTAATGLQFNFGGSGDNKPQTKPTLFPSTAITTQTLFTATPFATPTSQTTTTAPPLSFGTPGAIGSSTAVPPPQFGLSTKPGTTLTTLLGSTAATGTTTSSGLSFGSRLSSAPPITTPSTSGAPLFGVTSSASAAVTTTIPALNLSTPASTVTSSAASSTLSTSAVAPTYSTSTLPSTGSLTFTQLEDAINKWTIDLEDQGKFFINQAKQLNAWDSLLINNGEKILNLNSSIERVKQQQHQLDQELDFVLAQQKELEELITPLEKELLGIPVTDIDRNQMYQFSEIIDSQLKQMSDDLKEIIEHLNESNKDEEMSNPIIQVSRILNAHMNSLQWLDRNTAQISAQLEQISKIQDTNRRNFTLNHSFNNSFNM